MSNDVIEHSREVYDVLDYIGDVGGLFDGITYIVRAFLYLLSFIGYNPLLDYFYSNLEVNQEKSNTSKCYPFCSLFDQ